jgi:hypothetical protein
MELNILTILVGLSSDDDGQLFADILLTQSQIMKSTDYLCSLSRTIGNGGILLESAFESSYTVFLRVLLRFFLQTRDLLTVEIGLDLFVTGKVYHLSYFRI